MPQDNEPTQTLKSGREKSTTTMKEKEDKRWNWVGIWWAWENAAFEVIWGVWEQLVGLPAASLWPHRIPDVGKGLQDRISHPF